MSLKCRFMTLLHFILWKHQVLVQTFYCSKADTDMAPMTEIHKLGNTKHTLVMNLNILYKLAFARHDATFKMVRQYETSQGILDLIILKYECVHIQGQSDLLQFRLPQCQG